MKEFDTALLADIQKSNYLDVHQRHSVEVQRDPRPVAFDLRFQSIEMMRLQPTAQANDCLSPVGIFFNLQRHLRFLRRRRCNEETTGKFLKLFTLSVEKPAEFSAFAELSAKQLARIIHARKRSRGEPSKAE
jgi:hypothetical protein